MKLIDNNGNEVKPGARLTSFRGEKYILDDSREPHKPGSTGKVYVKTVSGEGFTREFYPGVFNLRFV